MGGAIGVCSATFRHGSASILSRLGGKRLESDGIQLPSYYDPQHRCMVEILRFDYRSTDARFEPLLRILAENCGIADYQQSLPELQISPRIILAGPKLSD